MTYAPKSYKDAQSYLCQRTGLPAVSVGLIGDAAHGTSGYHLGWDRVRLGKGLQDYSYRETARDRTRLTDGSAAIDVGWFSTKVGTRTVTLIDFNNWLIAECRAGAPDTSWIREVIYTTDRKTVRRYDRLGIRSTGDLSHLTHTHISGFRDAEDAPKKPLFERFFAAMAGSTANPAPQGDPDMLLFFAKLAGDPTVRLVESFMTNRFVSGVEFPVLKASLASNNIGGTVWEWPNDDAHRALFGVNLDPIDDDPEPLLATLSPEQLTALGVQIRQGVPSLDQIRGVVDEELDEQSRGGADNDAT
jgi:hypothetical protein